MICRYTVSLHRYLSQLTYSAIESISTCAPRPPPERLAPVYYRDAHIHTAKIMIAIERMTEMLTLPCRMAVHDPFHICMIAATTIAHLSACKNTLQGEALQIARERIRVAMGALEIFAEVWPRAKEVVKELKTIARELLKLGPTAPQSEMETPNRNITNSFAPQIQNDSSQFCNGTAFPAVDSSAYFDFPILEAEMSASFVRTDWNLQAESGFPYDVTASY